MNIKEIEEKVVLIVAEQMGIDKSDIEKDTEFNRDLNTDSLDMVELIMEFEDAFEMNIPDEELEGIKSVGQVIDYLAENQELT